MLKRKIHFFFILFLLLPVCHSYGQQPVSYNYTTIDGLPSSETYDIIQDSKGYIWIATDRGVSRFNGYTFRNFTTSEGLVDNTVLSLKEDVKGRIWFHGISGRLCYYDADSIRPYKYNNILAELNGKMVRSFNCDESDNIIIGTISRGLIKISAEGRVEKMEFSTGSDRTFTGDVLDGSLYLSIFSPQKGDPAPPLKTDKPGTKMVTMKFRDGAFTITENVTEKPITQVNTSGVKRKNGGYLIYGMGNFLEVYPDKRWKHLDTKNIVRMYEDSDSCLWISESATGVKRYASNVSVSSSNFQVYLPDEIVTCIYEDKEKGMWLATLSSGIFYFPSTKYLSYSFSPRASVTAISAVKNEKELLAGHSDGTLELINTGGIAKRWTLRDPEKAINYIYSVSSIDDTAIISSRRIHYFLTGNTIREIRGDHYYSRSITHDGQLFYGCGNGVLTSFDPAKNSSHHVQELPVRADVIYIDPNHRIWLGDHTGLYYLKDSQLVKAFPGEALLHERVSAISELGIGEMVIASIGKGILIIRNGRVADHLNTRSGLASDIVNCMVIRGNTIWAGTNKGITRIIIKNGKYEFRNYTTYNGLPGDEISQIAFTGNILWASTKKNVFRFDPQKACLNTIAPPIYIDGLTVAGKEADRHRKGAINYNEFPVRISYTGLVLKKRGAVSYRYKLHGLNEDWQYTTSTFIEFLSLPAGDYRLEISAQNEDGYWSDTPAVYNFSIIPPYWETWWFIMICILALFSLTVLLFFRRIRNIRRQNEMINSMLSYRQQALLNQMNPHFIFNSLNSIQTFILTEEKRPAARYISKFARLMRLNLDNSRNEFIPLDREIEAIGLYLELEKLRFKDLFSYHVEIDKNVEMENYLIPAMIIQPYIENCIKHAFNGDLLREGMMSLYFSMRESQLICRIEDNGIGRDQAESQKKHSDHKSAGLEITAQRLQLSSALLGQEFYLEIIDKKDGHGAAQGTIIILALPHKLLTDDKSIDR
ncbi:MAG: sensor histidine kinase [Bacteroidia bacterium]